MLTATNELYVIDATNSQPGSTLLVEATKDNIISLTVLYKAGFKVDFAVGRADDSCFGWILYTPEGIPIQLVFHDNLWAYSCVATPKCMLILFFILNKQRGAGKK